jgi:hypothetical protein
VFSAVATTRGTDKFVMFRATHENITYVTYLISPLAYKMPFIASRQTYCRQRTTFAAATGRRQVRFPPSSEER